MLKIYLLLISAIFFANCYIVVPGKCPVVPSKLNVSDVTKKLVTGWYVLKLFENKFDTNAKCLHNNIEYFNEESYKSIYTGVLKENNHKFRIPIVGKRKPNSTGIDFDFTVSFKNEPIDINGRIVAFEDDYFIAWGCTEIADNTIRYSYVETRYKVLPEKRMKEIKSFYDKYELGWSQLTDVDHENCDYDI